MKRRKSKACRHTETGISRGFFLSETYSNQITSLKLQKNKTKNFQNFQQRILCQFKASFRNEKEICIFHGNRK